MIILGIDPGKAGGLCVINIDEIRVEVFPFLTRGDAVAVLQSVAKEARDSHARAVAYIERVNACPVSYVDKASGKPSRRTMPATSAFAFGGNFEGWQWALSAVGIPFWIVAPSTWQATVGCSKGKGEARAEFKRRLKSRAQELFPTLKLTMKTCDAVLIAEHGVKKETPS